METKTTNRLHIAEERKVYARNKLVTLGDLEQFREDLLKGIKHLLIQNQTVPDRRWLKSTEIQKLLGISAGTLQHLRDTGQLPFPKLGGIIYYDYETIKSMMGKR